MTFPYKCQKHGVTSAQASADGTFCYMCKGYPLLTTEEVKDLIYLINEGDILAFVNMEMWSDAILTTAPKYRWCYFIDPYEKETNFKRSQDIACNTLCRQDVESAISQMSPVDLLILDAHEDYAGAKNDFYAFCGIVKVGGKIVLHTYGDPSFWQFIDELKQTRQIAIKGNLVIVDWK